MSNLKNRYPKKDQSKLKDGSSLKTKYDPKKENSPYAWEKYLSQEKYEGLIWEESNIGIYNELINKKGISS